MQVYIISKSIVTNNDDDDAINVGL